ncbi:MAG: hypothetical protein ACK5MY_05175 [Jhaorihella sp.]
MIRATLALSALLVAPSALTAEQGLPQGARLLSDWSSPLDSYELPMAAFTGSAVPSRRFEGRLERRTWRIPGSPGTTLQILAPLREQIGADGYEIVFECADTECGGFDFRFAVDVAPAPDMYVNLRDFRFLSAIRGEDSALSLLVSVSPTAAYVQEIRAMPAGK